MIWGKQARRIKELEEELVQTKRDLAVAEATRNQFSNLIDRMCKNYDEMVPAFFTLTNTMQAEIRERQAQKLLGGIKTLVEPKPKARKPRAKTRR